ncbi:DUF4178 domain-containing protein [Ruegeria sp. HKCCD8929]|uniref:DUF4178 domain-containing protein n=1 Tax=Ruegeria sp. HKCCD8929 TaxID=2683006 RepID=UPI0014894B5C|nr:DUF4178 domain-containing protein [Ruegeria sp. HKCCD8929]
MTRNPELLSINCTCCGAGLDVLGGGRVVVQICPYCGAELDAQDNYKTLRQFKDLKRPDTPLSIGMMGTLFGVEFTVIGLIEHSEQWGGRVYKWIDHQLYSATHGYAWLTLDAGHLVFSRRYRGPGWISERQVEISEHPPIAYAGGERFRYFETTSSTITYVEGEFTWHPKFGEQTTTISAMSNAAMLGFSTTGSERETYRSVYVPREAAEAAFGLTLNLKPYRTHPLQPFVEGPNYGFLLVTSLGFAVVCLFMAFFFSARSGQSVLYNHNVAASQLPVEITIPLRADSQLTRISFTGDVENSWAYLDLELLDPEGAPVFQAGRTIEYYSGRDADGSWREGTARASLKFRPEHSGDYVLALDVPEQGLWTGRGVGFVPDRPFNQLTVNVRTGLSSGYWAFALAGAFGVLFLYQFGRKWLHQRARWSGTDWVDED